MRVHPQIRRRPWRVSAPAAGWGHDRTSGILALVGDPALRDDVDRVAAAAGVPVVHAAEPSSRKAWTGAVAVLLDVHAARRCADARCRAVAGSSWSAGRTGAADWEAAIAVGAQHVITLPAQDGELVAELSDAGERAATTAARGAVIAVIGGRGGAGASVFAAALAQAPPTRCSVDADPWSGGIDLVLGSESRARAALARPGAAGRSAELRGVARRAAAAPRGQRAVGGRARWRHRRRAAGAR